MEKEGIDIKDSDFYKKQHEFGTLALTTNSQFSAQDRYKSRYQVEQMIDVFKNLYEAEVSYMQDEQAKAGCLSIT